MPLEKKEEEEKENEGGNQTASQRHNKSIFPLLAKDQNRLSGCTKAFMFFPSLKWKDKQNIKLNSFQKVEKRALFFQRIVRCSYCMSLFTASAF